MGIDIIGRQPRGPVGELFRTTLSAWRPIHDLIIQLCCDLFDEETLAGLANCEGFGADDPVICTAMVTRFERWMEYHVSGHQVDVDLRTQENREIIQPQRPDDAIRQQTAPVDRVDDEMLKDWIDFLRDCGGFEVW